MSIGTVARRILGPVFPLVGSVYRRVFVDVRAVAEAVPYLPDGALLLDVGGGDGALLNPILRNQPSIRATLIDVAPKVGGFIRPEFADRISLHPSTSVRDYIDAGGEPPAAVLIADVFHHVEPGQREQLIRDLFDVFGDAPPLIAVKDVEPEGWRARAGFWADLHISGEHTWPLSQTGVVDLFRSIRPEVDRRSTRLFAADRPNYCVIFR